MGWLFLGNPDNYKMLGYYTSRFGNAQTTLSYFAEQGLEVTYLSYFFGCATGLKGRKPKP